MFRARRLISVDMWPSFLPPRVYPLQIGHSMSWMADNETVTYQTPTLWPPEATEWDKNSPTEAECAYAEHRLSGVAWLEVPLVVRHQILRCDIDRGKRLTNEVKSV